MMLMITVVIGRQKAGARVKAMMNVHNGHALAVCLPAKWRQVHDLYNNNKQSRPFRHKCFLQSLDSGLHMQPFERETRFNRSSTSCTCCTQQATVCSSCRKYPASWSGQMPMDIPWPCPGQSRASGFRISLGFIPCTSIDTIAVAVRGFPSLYLNLK